jgi:hypothetical protein
MIWLPELPLNSLGSCSNFTSAANEVRGVHFAQVVEYLRIVILTQGIG